MPSDLLLLERADLTNYHANCEFLKLLGCPAALEPSTLSPGFSLGRFHRELGRSYGEIINNLYGENFKKTETKRRQNRNKKKYSFRLKATTF